MKKFEEPKIKIITFASDDVITTSGFLEPEKDGYINNNDQYDISNLFI